MMGGALPMLLHGGGVDDSQMGLDGLVDSRVLCCVRAVDEVVLTDITGIFSQNEPITIRRSDVIVATGTLDAILTSAIVTAHGVTAEIASGDEITGDSSGAVGTVYGVTTGIMDIGPQHLTVSNAGLTVGAADTGPFAGDRAITDPTAAAYALITSSLITGAKSAFFRVLPQYSTNGRILFNYTISAGISTGRNNIMIGTIGRAGGKVAIYAESYPGASSLPHYAVVGPDIDAGAWVDVYLDFSSGLALWLDGLKIGEETFNIPFSGNNLMIGLYRSGDTIYGGYGNLADVTLYSQPVGIPGGTIPERRLIY